MKTIAAIAFALFATAASAQYDEPPREAFGLGLVLMYEHQAVATYQAPNLVRDACGNPDGCFVWVDAENGNDFCQIHVNVRHPPPLRELIFRNLVARCAGWEQ